MEFFNEFETFLKMIDNQNEEILITGDFNCDLLKSDCHRRNIKQPKELIDIYQLQQHIDRYCLHKTIDRYHHKN